MSESVLFDRLPLGARFRYAGDKGRVYVSLGRGDAQCGSIAVWHDPSEKHGGPFLDWRGQQLFALSDSPGEREKCLVDWLDAPLPPDLQAAAHGYADDLKQDREADARDARRYRWLRDGNAYKPEEEHVQGGEMLDLLCDTKGEDAPYYGRR